VFGSACGVIAALREDLADRDNSFSPNTLSFQDLIACDRQRVVRRRRSVVNCERKRRVMQVDAQFPFVIADIAERVFDLHHAPVSLGEEVVTHRERARLLSDDVGLFPAHRCERRDCKALVFRVGVVVSDKVRKRALKITPERRFGRERGLEEHFLALHRISVERVDVLGRPSCVVATVRKHLANCNNSFSPRTLSFQDFITRDRLCTAVCSRFLVRSKRLLLHEVHRKRGGVPSTDSSKCHVRRHDHRINRMDVSRSTSNVGGLRNCHRIAKLNHAFESNVRHVLSLHGRQVSSSAQVVKLKRTRRHHVILQNIEHRRRLLHKKLKRAWSKTSECFIRRNQKSTARRK